MKLLKTIYEKDIGLEQEKLDIDYRKRNAARAIIFDNSKNIALLYVKKDDKYKLPGGGVKEDEDIEQGLRREVLEEAGANINIKQEIGKILEYRNKINLEQESFCYIAEVVGEASNGEDAVSLYKDLKPDLVTMDLIMPNYDGLRAIDTIIKYDKAANIVVVSAMGQELSVAEAMQKGAKEYIKKPFNN